MSHHNIKVFKFSDPLPDLVLSGKKDTTWRIGHDDVTIDNVLSLCRDDGTEFARAKPKWIKSTRFGYLTEEDKKGHESFSSDEEMYRTYSRYYNINVTPDTPLNVIKYELL